MLQVQWSGRSTQRCRAHKAKQRITPAERTMRQQFRTIMVDDVWTPERIDRVARALRTAQAAAITHVAPVYDPSNPASVKFWGDAHDSFEALVQRTIETAGKKAIASLDVSMSFSVDNPYTVDAIRAHTGELITGLSEQAQGVVRDLVEQAFVQHIPPEDLAEMLRPVLSLDERSAAAVARRMQSNIDGGMGATRAARVAREAADKLLDDRAETIARTEIITAEDRGRQAAWADAVNQGVLGKDAKRVWIAAMGSERTCPICEELDGQTVGLNEPFHSDILGEDLDGPTAHPRCRCSVAIA